MRTAISALIAASFLVPGSTPTPAWGGEAIESAVAATVYLEVERVTPGGAGMTTGTAFFIHPDGYLLTSEHVVADVLTLPDGRRIRASVSRIRVVVDPSLPTERALDATVVATDREVDLALLQVRYQPEAWLDPAAWRPAMVTDEIWVVGFPLGDLLGLYDRAQDRVGRPSTSINGGRVTSLRRDGSGEIKLIQTDAAVNYGNSGGPLVDGDGKLLGVVSMKITGAEGLGFGLPWSLVQDFLAEKSLRIRFTPPRLYRQMPPLRVSVEPIFSPVVAFAGEVALERGANPPRKVALRASGQTLVASFEISPEDIDAAVDGRLRARIDITSRASGQTIQRAFALGGMSVGPAPGHAPSATARRDMPREQAEPTPGPAAGMLGGGMLGGKQVDNHRQAETAGDLPTVVIDNSLMYEREGFVYAEWRYQAIPSDAAREAALEYEKLVAEIMRLKARMERLRETDPKVDWSRNDRHLRYQNQREEAIRQARRESLKLRGFGVCRCGALWVMCADAPCEEPVRPWEGDIF